MSNCTQCPKGKFTPSLGYESCLSCAAGKSTSKPGGVECRNLCLQGFAGEGGVEPCKQCRYGEVSVNWSVCSNCSLGFFPLLNATACEACGLGLYQRKLGEPCQPCTPGYDTQFLASTACTVCTPGKFSNISGATVCLVCDPGHRSMYEQGSTACVPCGPGENVSASGASCVPCRPGTFSTAGMCLACPQGTYMLTRVVHQCALCVPWAPHATLAQLQLSSAWASWTQRFRLETSLKLQLLQ